MNFSETINLLQFRAAYNLPVHAGIESGIFASHGLCVDAAYTPGSRFLSEALRAGRCDIGHTGADDVIADVESIDGSDLFIFMGLHPGLFSLVGAPDCPVVDSLRGKSIGVDAKTSGLVLVLVKWLQDRGFASDDYSLIEIGGWQSRYESLIAGRISATLLTEPFVENSLNAGGHLLTRDFEMIPTYQGTCGAASRSWAERHPDRIIRYIRAYVEATEWCFASENRRACLDMLARHNDIQGSVANHTLDALLDPRHGLYPRAAVNLPGVLSTIELRAELGYMAQPIPPAEKYVELAYYRNALAIGESQV